MAAQWDGHTSYPNRGYSHFYKFNNCKLDISTILLAREKCLCIHAKKTRLLVVHPLVSHYQIRTLNHCQRQQIRPLQHSQNLPL